MMVQIVQGMIKDTSGRYHDFIVNTVLTNPVLFAHLVAWGETLVGISLFFGLLTRLGGLGGVFLALNYFAAKGSFSTLSAWTGFDILAAVMSLACVVLPVNAIALDRLVFRRKRRIQPG